MAYSAQTTNYGLPLPTGTDKSTWLDNNEAFQAVDTALTGAVAKGTTNEAAIGTLAQRMTTAEANIATDGADIDALETRMTANEQVAGNALTGVAQLSEKVYEYEEKSFNGLSDLYDYLQTLDEEKLRNTYVSKLSNFTTDAGPVSIVITEGSPGTITFSIGSPENITWLNKESLRIPLIFNTDNIFCFCAPLNALNNTGWGATILWLSGNNKSVGVSCEDAPVYANNTITINKYRRSHTDSDNSYAVSIMVPKAVADD